MERVSFNSDAHHHMRSSQSSVGWRPLGLLAAYSSTLLLCFWFGTMVPPALASEGSVEAAYNAGQLEYMSLMLGIVGTGLTVIGVVLAVAAAFGFWMIREAALAAAQREARRWMDAEAPKLLREFSRLGMQSGSEAAAPADVQLDPEKEQQVMDQATEVEGEPREP